MEPNRTLPDEDMENENSAKPGPRSLRAGRTDADAERGRADTEGADGAHGEPEPALSTTSTTAASAGASGASAKPGSAGTSGKPARPGTEDRPPAPPVLCPIGARRFWPRSFAARLTAPLPDVRALVRAAREGTMRPEPETLSGVAQLPYEPEPLPEARPGRVSATWVGHASWVLRIGGLTVLTDPVWSRRILGTPARVTPPGVAWEDLPPVDAVVVSHNHYDHLDAPTLRRLPRSTPLFVPAGLARWCRRRGFTSVTELDWWEAAELPAGDGEGRVRFQFVPSHHWSRRTLTDTCRSLWGGWVLTGPERGHGDGYGNGHGYDIGEDIGDGHGNDIGDGYGEGRKGNGRGHGGQEPSRGRQRVYFAGDTGYGHWFAEIGRRCPGIDLALLPVGAYEPRWMLKPVHTSPEEAVQACADVGARAMAPMHYATFLLSAEPPMEPLERVRAAWAAAGRARGDLWDLPVGGSRVLHEADG